MHGGCAGEAGRVKSSEVVQQEAGGRRDQREAAVPASDAVKRLNHATRATQPQVVMVVMSNTKDQFFYRQLN